MDVVLSTSTSVVDMFLMYGGSNTAMEIYDLSFGSQELSPHELDKVTLVRKFDWL
jgi:hypothetical protein